MIQTNLCSLIKNLT